MRTFTLAILGLTLSTHLLTGTAIRPVQAADPQPTVASQSAAQPKKVKPPLLTWQEKRFLFPIEKRLVTPFNSKANPGDRDTYFVLMFRDVAGVQTHSRTRGSSSVTESLTTEVAQWDGAIIIHGHKEAALTVARFLTPLPKSANDLPDSFGRYQVKQKLGEGAKGRWGRSISPSIHCSNGRSRSRRRRSTMTRTANCCAVSIARRGPSPISSIPICVRSTTWGRSTDGITFRWSSCRERS